MLSTTSTYQPTVSPADALWTLYQSQTKKVRDAFRVLILSEGKIKESQTIGEENMKKLSDDMLTDNVESYAYDLFDDTYMSNLISLSASAWQDVNDADKWIHELRGE